MKKTWWTRFLIRIGYLCPRCGGKTLYNDGWGIAECTGEKCTWDSRKKS